jgi:uncharacterized membrane protein
MQVTAAITAGVGLLVGGEVATRRKLPLFAQSLTSLGIVALYGSGLVAYQLHELWTIETAFGFYIAVTVVSFLLAARSNAISVVLLGMLGGYLTPVLLSTGRDQPVAFFMYLWFMNLAICATAIFKRWTILKPIALVATAIMALAWGLKFYSPDRAWLLAKLTAWHAGLFIAAGVAPFALLGRKTTHASLWAMAKAAMGYYALTWWLFHNDSGQRLGEFGAALAVGHWLLAGGIHLIRRKGDEVLAWLSGVGAILLTAAVPIYFKGDHIAIAWAAQAAVFTLIGVAFKRNRTVLAATGVYLLAIGWTIWHDILPSDPRGILLGLDARFATAAIVAAIVGIGGLVHRFSRYELIDLNGDPIRNVPLRYAITADLLLVTAAKLQFPGPQLGYAFVVNAIVVAALAAWRQDARAKRFAQLVSLAAIAPFLNYTPIGDWFGIAAIDAGFGQGVCIAIGLLVVARLARRAATWTDLPSAATALVTGGAAILMYAATLQWPDYRATAAWVVVVLGLLLFARWASLSFTAWLAVAGFGATAARWLDPSRAGGESVAAWPVISTALAAGGPLVIAGWMGAFAFRGREPKHLATALALATNVVLLLVINRQWDSYLVGALWALTAAGVWTISAKWRHLPGRQEALAIWVVLLPAWIWNHGIAWTPPLEQFRPIVNVRFAAVGLIALIGLVGAWAYRRFDSQWRLAGGGRSDREADYAWPVERRVRAVLAVLANLILAVALTADVQTLFDVFAARDTHPFANPDMARQATLSILWTGHAAALFIVGFAIRYKPIRLLAMVSLAPIVVKVFVVDLRHLDVIYRVASFAVLGLVFLGVHWLYQKYRGRISGDESPPRPATSGPTSPL